MIAASKTQLEHFRGKLKHQLKLTKIKPYTLGSDYARKNFRIMSEAKGATTGPWKPRRWQIDISDAYTCIDYHEITWLKPSRTGASKIALSAITQCVDELKQNTLMYQPDDGDSEHFVKTEVDPLYQRLAVLQPIKLKNSKKYDTLIQKQFAGNIWHFLGGNTPKNYRRLSVDLVIIDELAAFLAEIGKDGDARSLARTRITESPLGKLICQSSPLVMPGCQITAAFNDADFQFKFYVPCPKCAHTQYMDFWEDGSKGIRWDQETKGLSRIKRARTACYRCTNPECEAEHSYYEMQQAIELGRWETEDRKHWLERGKVTNKKGQRTERRWHIGFQSNCFMSPAFSFEQFADEYLKAAKQMENGREGPMKTLHQNRLGRAWVENTSVTNINYRTIKHKNAIRYPDDGTFPEQIVASTMAVDVQGDRLEALDVGWAEGEECYAMRHTVIPGDTYRGEPWPALAELLRERRENPFKTETGREIPPFLVGIDHGGHWKEAVEQFCIDEGPREHLAIKGELGVDEMISKFPRKPQQSGCWLVMNATDTAKVLLFKRTDYARDKELWVNPGCVNFPKDDQEGYENFDERFYKQFASESRIINPNGKIEWKVSGRNEILDLMVMNLCLIKTAQLPQYGLKLKGSEDAERMLQRKKSRSRYDMRSYGKSLKTRKS